MKKLTLSDQAQFTLQLRVSLSEIVHRFLACPPLTFHRSPKPFSATRQRPLVHVGSCRVHSYDVYPHDIYMNFFIPRVTIAPFERLFDP